MSNIFRQFVSRPRSVASAWEMCDPDSRGTRAGWVVGGLVFGALMLLGCGYSTRSLYPSHIRTVAVPIFENRSFYRGLEFDLTEALIKEIELRTPYKVTLPPQADTILQGTIVRVDQRLLSSTRHGALPQELELEAVVNFHWKDARTGRVLCERRDLVAVGRYVPVRAVGETYSTAQHQLVQDLAGRIVGALAAWPGLEPAAKLEQPAPAESPAASVAGPENSR